MHFGKPIISKRTGLPEDSTEVALLYEKLYAEFVEALDAHDNGISVYDPAQTKGLRKRFNDGGVTLGSLVGDMNNEWKDDPLHEQVSSSGTAKVQRTPEQIQADEDARFLQASSLMGTTFLRKLSYYHSAWLPARKLVHTAYKDRFSRDASGAVMVLDGGSVPWKDHLYTFEAEDPAAPKVLYVLYPEGPNEGAKWRIQCVSVTKDSFESRKPLKEEWRGLRDEELSDKSKIQGCVFVHASGFIGGNKTREGAFEMAKRCLTE